MSIRRSLPKSIIFGILFVTLFLGIATVSLAEQKEEGMYFSILGVENYVEEDFDGVSAGKFENSNTICTFPKIKNGTGFGMLIGGYNEKMAGELFYACSNHDTNYTYVIDSDNDGILDSLYRSAKDGEVQLIGINIKYYFANLFNKNVRFFSQIGIIYPIITLEQAAFVENNFQNQSDVTYTGFGLDAGIGILIHLHPKLAISGAAVLRYLRIKQAEAFGEERVPSESTYGHGRSYTIGVNYYF